MVELDAKWADVLCSQPETGMGYQIVTATLKSGKQYPQVVIAGGTITNVRGYSAVPFASDDIIGIEVTHDTWDWSQAKSAR